MVVLLTTNDMIHRSRAFTADVLDSPPQRSPAALAGRSNCATASRAGDEGQDFCGFYNADYEGARCCDNCQYTTEYAKAICCEVGWDLCEPDGLEGYGCCPRGAMFSNGSIGPRQCFGTASKNAQRWRDAGPKQHKADPVSNPDLSKIIRAMRANADACS